MSVPRAAEQLADRPGKSTVCFSVYDVARGGSPKVTCCSDDGSGRGRGREEQEQDNVVYRGWVGVISRRNRAFVSYVDHRSWYVYVCTDMSKS